MKRATIYASCLALVLFLGGCTGAQQDHGTLSLMERFHSGQPLIGTEPDLTADAKDRNLSDEQKQARQALMRGLAYAQQERGELAFEQYSRAASLDPTLMQARYQRGLIMLEQGMPAQALDEFKAVMELEPTYAPGYAAAGRVYFSNGLYPEAEKLFDKALEMDPQLLEAYDHLGAIHNYNKQYDKALGTFQKALMINPNASYLYNNLGLAYAMMGRDDDAIQAFRKAVMQGAPSGKAYNNMGLALCRMGRYREGLEAFRAADGEAAAWNNLGYFFFLDGQHDRAIKSFEKAIELQPTYYERAAENLKRARLAAQFAEHAENAPARPRSEDDLFAPKAPVIPSSHPAVEPLQPGVMPVSTMHDAAPSVASLVREAPIIEPAHALISESSARNADMESSTLTFVLHLSSFRTQVIADAEAARLNKRHLNARVLPVHIPGKGDWYRVVIGDYPSVDQAHDAMQALAEQRKELSGMRVVSTTAFAAEESAPVRMAEQTHDMDRQGKGVPADAASKAEQAAEPQLPAEATSPVPEQVMLHTVASLQTTEATRNYAATYIRTAFVPQP